MCFTNSFEVWSSFDDAAAKGMAWKPERVRPQAGFSGDEM